MYTYVSMNELFCKFITPDLAYENSVERPTVSKRKCDRALACNGQCCARNGAQFSFHALDIMEILA